MILLCKHCKPHKFQDGTYGKNMRVHNPVKKTTSGERQRWRCTVCLNVREG